MQINLSTKRLSLLAMLSSALLASCSGTRPTDLGLTNGALAACPSSPNCVSSTATDSGHAIEPFSLAVTAEEAWPALRKSVVALQRTALVADGPDYIHAECSSSLLGFVDDLELALSSDGSAILVRSASRLGYSDMGVNRQRVDELRSALQEAGVIN
jgi:uncharacterized protein (DUF1499 family)